MYLIVQHPIVTLITIIYQSIFRDFLRELPADVCRFPAGIKSSLEDYGKLLHFSALNRKNINWDVERRQVIVEGDNLPAQFLPEPKHRKT